MPPTRRFAAALDRSAFRHAGIAASLAVGLIVPLTPLSAASREPAGKIFWGSEGFVRNVDSLGDGWDQDFVVAMGVFREGFVPSMENRNEWRTHWNDLDRAGYDAEEGRFAGETPVVALPEGAARQVYFWVWNGEDIAEGPEWLLLGNPSWIWPSSPASLPMVWTTSDAGSVVVGTISGGDIRLRTAAIAPVPEEPAEWWARHFEGEPDWEADPDADGLANLAEYALGRDPWRPDGTSATELVPTVSGVRVRLSRNAYSAAVAALEVSDDLNRWLPAGDGIETLSEKPGMLEFVDRGEPGRRFFRFQFTLPEK